MQALLSAAGFNDSLTTPMLNMIGYYNLTSVSQCDSGDQDDCFGTRNASYYYNTSTALYNYRSWPYQYCTEWGYLQTGNAPADQLPLISRTITTDYSSIICREAFNLTEPADTDRINKLGGFNISYPRLALIDGEIDPWRPAGSHANPFNATAVNRTSTPEEPWILISQAVHHWDENGVFANQTRPGFPPAPIVDTQSMELEFVKGWLAEWKNQTKG